MGGYMPYQLEKGPYFSVTESVFDDLDGRIHALIGLRNHVNPDDMPTLESSSLNTAVGNVRTHDQRLKHQNHEWYGKQPLPNNRWADQPKFDEQYPKPTGFWHNWYGDAEGIVRETFVRAIEVSLGIPHDPKMIDPVWIDQNKKRTWPIEIFTRCPAPWFEGWVTWRGKSPAHGHVTVHLHTPSHENSLLLKSPVREPGYHTPEYRDEEDPVPPPSPPEDPKPPLPSGGEHGMWVISHKFQDLVKMPFIGPLTTQTSPTGAPWAVPWFGGMVWSHDKIVVVRPSEPNGGVLPDGRPYLP
jgi:hypothetical protein